MMTDDLIILDTGTGTGTSVHRSTRIPHTHTHTRYLDSRRLHPKSTVHDEYVADNNGWMIMIMFGCVGHCCRCTAAMLRVARWPSDSTEQSLYAKLS